MALRSVHPQDAVVAKQYTSEYSTYLSTAKYWTGWSRSQTSHVVQFPLLLCIVAFQEHGRLWESVLHNSMVHYLLNTVPIQRVAASS
jgi:hypothetical protein